MQEQSQPPRKKGIGYTKISILGEGSFAKVYSAKKDTDPSGKVYALKVIEKKAFIVKPKLKELFETELNVLSKLNHPNILKLYEYLESGNHLFIVTDLCAGGDFKKFLDQKKYLPEATAVFYLMQLMNGFRELHKHKIMHRDFKLENIFMKDENTVVIGDFGAAKDGSENTSTIVGTLITKAPEVGTALEYNNKIDLWSCGVVFYQMLFGIHPWVHSKIATTDVRFRKEIWENSGENLYIPDSPKVSSQCKALLKSMIEADPEKRLSWKELFNHSFFQEVILASSPREHKAGEAPTTSRITKQLFELNMNQPLQDNTLQTDLRKVDLATTGPSSVPKDLASSNPYASDIGLLGPKVQEFWKLIAHNRKLLIFMLHTCKKLRLLSKREAELGDITSHFSGACLLLLKKALVMNQTQLADFQTSRQIHKHSLNSDVCKKIESEIQADRQLAETLFQHLQSKLKEGGGNSDLSQLNAVASSPSVKLEEITKKLDLEFLWLLDFYNDSKSGLDRKLKKDIAISLSHLYLSIKCSSEFEYQNSSGTYFSWEDFERNLSKDWVKGVLRKAARTHKTTA